MVKKQPIKILITGAGRRSYWAMQVMKGLPEFELAGVCDTVPARARFLIDELNLSHLPLFATFAASLQHCEFDAVFIATHDAAHADVAVPALKAGKYIYLEKPLDISEARCNSIVDADRRAGGKTFVGFNLRYAPLYATMHKLVDDGIVGKVLTIESNEFYDGGRSYFRRWNRLRRCGGGLWITKSTHDFDIIQWMAGAPVETVCAFDQLSFYRHKPGAALYCRDCRLRRTCPDVYDASPKTFYGRWFHAPL
jgi:predicted dehydrogenase